MTLTEQEYRLGAELYEKRALSWKLRAPAFIAAAALTGLTVWAMVRDGRVDAVSVILLLLPLMLVIFAVTEPLRMKERAARGRAAYMAVRGDAEVTLGLDTVTTVSAGGITVTDAYVNAEGLIVSEGLYVLMLDGKRFLILPARCLSEKEQTFLTRCFARKMK